MHSVAAALIYADSDHLSVCQSVSMPVICFWAVKANHAI